MANNAPSIINISMRHRCLFFDFTKWWFVTLQFCSFLFGFVQICFLLLVHCWIKFFCTKQNWGKIEILPSFLVECDTVVDIITMRAIVNQIRIYWICPTLLLACSWLQSIPNHFVYGMITSLHGPAGNHVHNLFQIPSVWFPWKRRTIAFAHPKLP